MVEKLFGIQMQDKKEVDGVSFSLKKSKYDYVLNILGTALLTGVFAYFLTIL